ncbi:MAG: IS4 family transposase [Chthoniobacterales bacterium]
MSNKTPFFRAFGPLLFGRAPRRAADQISRIKGLEDLYSLFGDPIPKAILSPTKKGVGSRDRSLPAQVTFWAFVAQVMSPGMGCREVVNKVAAWWRWAQIHPGRSVSASAYSQARSRLDKEVLGVIARRVAWSLDRNTLSAERWLRGRHVKIIDGTSLSMPDTPENQAIWPQPSSQKPGCGFPLMKLTGLFSLSSGALIDHATSNEHVHESQLFRQMWPRLSRGDVLLGDRGFCSYTTMASLSGRGIDGVFRLHQARKIDFRQGRRLGHDDRLIRWTKPDKTPAGFSDEEFAALPATLSLRMIRLRVSNPGFRTRSVVLVTTLLDPELYPADDIRALYGERWNVELHFHQIKTLMALDVLRCRTPEMIEKELLVHLIAYNLVRVLMQRAAH